MLILYRKNGSSIPQYINHLEYILSTHQIDIIMGDFNINYLDNSNAKHLHQILKQLQYTQTVENPTFVTTGSLIDHIFIRNQILPASNTSILSVYYSDHDAIKISLDLNKTFLD